MNSRNSSAGQAGRVLGAEVETGDREPVPGQAAADGAADAALPVHIGDVVEIKEKHEISQLDASAVELDAADLGAGPAEAVGDLITGETGALTEPAQFGGEPTATDGRAAIFGHPSDSLRGWASRFGVGHLAEEWPNCQPEM